jgi:hypothetical protein
MTVQLSGDSVSNPTTAVARNKRPVELANIYLLEDLRLG